MAKRLWLLADFAALVVLIFLFFSIFSQPRPGSLKGHLYTTRTPIYATVRAYFLYSFLSDSL